MPAKRRKPTPTKRTKPAPRGRRKFDPANPHWIPGIHYYCDRWCERCEFSHRCLRFALAERIHGSGGARKMAGARTVFDALDRMFQETRHELDEAARSGIRSGDERSVAAHVAVEKRLHRRALSAGARETKAALTYARIVDEWFNNELKLPLEHVRSLEERVHKGLIRVSDAKGDLVRLNESVEIIRWHQHLPYVKLCRALISRVEEDTAREGSRNRDSDGSAKVALVSIEESIAAWTQVSEMFTEKTDSVLEILVHLTRLRRAIEQRFPKARKFKRPGFDEKPRRKRKAPG